MTQQYVQHSQLNSRCFFVNTLTVSKNSFISHKIVFQQQQFVKVRLYVKKLTDSPLRTPLNTDIMNVFFFVLFFCETPHITDSRVIITTTP